VYRRHVSYTQKMENQKFCDECRYILSQLGFEWQPIRDEVFSQYAKKLLASNLTQ
jgi:hypothetical protein